MLGSRARRFGARPPRSSRTRTSELVVAQENLRRLADRDPLTGTINRRALRDIFNDVQATGAMLLFFDLDGFKKINDVHGHAAGDDCLKLFANALRESFRPDDHVVRYGGDEFLVSPAASTAPPRESASRTSPRVDGPGMADGDLVRLLGRHVGAGAGRIAGDGAADRRSEHVQRPRTGSSSRA